MLVPSRNGSQRSQSKLWTHVPDVEALLDGQTAHLRFLVLFS